MAWLCGCLVVSMVFATAAWHYGLVPGSKEESIYSDETRAAMQTWSWPLWLLIQGMLLSFVLLHSVGMVISWILRPVMFPIRWFLDR